MTGFTSPNYTQVPNDLFEELMQVMSGAELKVVLAIIRQTIGYHRDTAKFSLSKIATMTGLSPNAVTKGAKLAEERGLIRRTNPDDTLSAEWELIVEILPPQKMTPSKNDPPQKVRELKPKPPQKVRETPSKNDPQVGLKKDEIYIVKKEETTTKIPFSQAELLFCEVTGLFVLPANQRRQSDIDIIETSIKFKGIEATRSRMEAAWAWWKTGKGKNGRAWSRTNTAWLDKVQTDEPLPAHVIPPDNNKPDAGGGFYG